MEEEIKEEKITEQLPKFTTECKHEWVYEGQNLDNGLYSYVCMNCPSGMQVAKKLEA